MSTILRPSNFAPIDVNDRLLAEVAVRIQLSPTNYRLATERYQTIAGFLDEHPDLPAEIVGIFPQGSMATGTTIAARDEDEFDIDLVADLGADAAWTSSSPATILDLLYAIFRSSDRYRSMVKRQTRCVTITYADRMHLDITPWQPRDIYDRGVVMHHRHEDRSVDAYGARVPSSPRLFADWFESQMPNEEAFARFFAEQSRAYDMAAFLERKAEIDDVPPHDQAFQKPRAKIALQLLKRFRNRRYATRSGRCPPSILLAKVIADFAPGAIIGVGLYPELMRLLGAIIDVFASPLEQYNPKDDDESLVDRWPADERDRILFVTDLEYLCAQLERFATANLAQKRRILDDLFGETPAQYAVEILEAEMQQKVPSGKQPLQKAAVGGLIVGGTPSPQTSYVPPRKDFYGDDTVDL